MLSRLILLTLVLIPGKIHAAAVPVPAAEETGSLNELLCPKVGEQMISNSKKTLLTMSDYFDTLLEKREKVSSFYIALLELKKERPEHEIAANQIKEINQGISAKLDRALNNYNEELRILAANLPKAKRCWGYHSVEQKQQISDYLELFQTAKILSEFKSCTRAILATNQKANDQLALSFQYYNKQIDKKTLLSNAKKAESNLKKSLKTENSVCKNFIPKGKFYNQLHGKVSSKEGSAETPKTPLINLPSLPR